VASTHVLAVADGLVTKRYTSWRRGEHRREWAVLRRLHRHAEGLAPQPIRATLDATPPTVTMTLVPGRPLSGGCGGVEVAGLSAALRTLWSVPLGGEPTVDDWTDDLHFARPLVETDWPDPPREIAEALVAATHWWRGPDPDLLRERPTTLVLGHRDPNLANYLWDGHQIRVVDFEDARASDPATELALLAEHLSTRELDPDRLLSCFTVDERRLRASRRLWAMFWLSLLRPGSAAIRRNPVGTERRQARRLLDLLR
jgi:hypothetical protein